jgi:hypothetical protein
MNEVSEQSLATGLCLGSFQFGSQVYQGKYLLKLPLNLAYLFLYFLELGFSEFFCYVIIGNVHYGQKSAYSRDAAMEKATRKALKHPRRHKKWDPKGPRRANCLF